MLDPKQCACNTGNVMAIEDEHGQEVMCLECSTVFRCLHVCGSHLVVAIDEPGTDQVAILVAGDPAAECTAPRAPYNLAEAMQHSDNMKGSEQ